MTVVFILMVLLVLVLGFILHLHHAQNKKRLHHHSGDTVYTIPSGSPSAKTHADGCENNSYFGFGGDGGGDCGGGGGD